MGASRRDINRTRIYQILDEMMGKFTRDEISDRLDAENLIPDPDRRDYVKRFTLTQMEEFSRTRVKEGQPDQEMLHLTENMPDGTVQDYFKKPPETSRTEAIQYLESLKKIRGSADKKLLRSYKTMCKIHGKRWIDAHFTLEDERVEANLANINGA